MRGKMTVAQVIFIDNLTFSKTKLCVFAEIKKFLPQNEPMEIPKPKKPQVLLGDVIKAAHKEGKFDLGR